MKDARAHRQYHPYRFPPLALPATFDVAAAGAGAGQQWQSSLAEGYQQGVNTGYAEGHATGLEAGREQGLIEGRAAGVGQGREQGRSETLVAHDSLARPVDAMLKALKKLQADYQKAQRKEVVDLVAKVARQVIRAELALQPAQLLTLVDETLAAMPASKAEIEVYLNPEELSRIRELDPKRAKRWTLIADPRLEAGECRVKSGDLEADAGCQQRLAACMGQVSAGLLEAHEGAEVAA